MILEYYKYINMKNNQLEQTVNFLLNISWQKYKSAYICITKTEMTSLKKSKSFEISDDINNAKVAQLVEHNLAKVGVASSNLVFRSKCLPTRGHLI